MASRLLLFNLMTDADDPVLGFTTSWINALAPKIDAIDVLTMQIGRLAVANNVTVYSVGKEKGFSEPRRAVEFYRILWSLLRQNHYDACFAHMMPLFAAMGSPLLKLYQIPITLWFTHEATPFRLRLAEKLSDHIVTASAESFRLPSSKLKIVGHGIDTSIFAPAQPSDNPPHDRLEVYSIGRLGPIKRLEILIEAVRILVHEMGVTTLRVTLVGKVYPHDKDYASELQSRVANYNIENIVRFEESIPFSRIVAEHQKAHIEINLRKTGGMDKAALESMACGNPVLFVNETFKSITADHTDALFISEGNPKVLADRLALFAAMPLQEIRAIGRDLRDAVIRSHSLEKLTNTLIELWGLKFSAHQ